MGLSEEMWLWEEVWEEGAAGRAEGAAQSSPKLRAACGVICCCGFLASSWHFTAWPPLTLLPLDKEFELIRKYVSFSFQEAP